MKNFRSGCGKTSAVRRREAALENDKRAKLKQLLPPPRVRPKQIAEWTDNEVFAQWNLSRQPHLTSELKQRLASRLSERFPGASADWLLEVVGEWIGSLSQKPSSHLMLTTAETLCAAIGGRVRQVLKSDEAQRRREQRRGVA